MCFTLQICKKKCIKVTFLYFLKYHQISLYIFAWFHVKQYASQNIFPVASITKNDNNKNPSGNIIICSQNVQIYYTSQLNYISTLEPFYKINACGLCYVTVFVCPPPPSFALPRLISFIALCLKNLTSIFLWCVTTLS